jgi:hypothetical protein
MVIEVQCLNHATMLQAGIKYGVPLQHQMHCVAGAASPDNCELVANHIGMQLALRLSGGRI